MSPLLERLNAAFKSADYTHTLVQLYRADPAELREFIREDLDTDDKEETIVDLVTQLSGLLKMMTR